MSILNVNQIQPVGGGNTITVNASDVNFSGNISIGSSFVGTASTATLATISQGLTGTPDITVNNIQSGIVTATTFIGDGSGLTGVTASGSGINIKDSGSTVGVAATIDFSTNLNVSPASAGIVTVTVGDTDFEIADKIIHTGDTNTAIRFPADDTITAETGGSERLRITSTGSVGIGTISVPNNFNVEIANNGSTGLNLRNTNDSANDSCRIAFSQGSGNLTSGNTFADIFAVTDSVSPLSGHIRFRTNGGNNLTERLRIQSGGGISFNGDTAAANALDDYEEGTWTPQVVTGTVSGVNGKYTKIGRLVTVSGYVNNFSDRSTSTPVRVSNLPFTDGDSNDSCVGSFFGRFITKFYHGVYMSGDTLYFYGTVSTDYNYLEHDDLSNSGSTIYFRATYHSDQ